MGPGPVVWWFPFCGWVRVILGCVGTFMQQAPQGPHTEVACLHDAWAGCAWSCTCLFRNWCLTGLQFDHLGSRAVKLRSSFPSFCVACRATSSENVPARLVQMLWRLVLQSWAMFCIFHSSSHGDIALIGTTELCNDCVQDAGNEDAHPPIKGQCEDWTESPSKFACV